MNWSKRDVGDFELGGKGGERMSGGRVAMWEERMMEAASFLLTRRGFAMDHVMSRITK